MHFILRNFMASQNNEGGTTKMSKFSNYEPLNPSQHKDSVPIQKNKAVISTFFKITHQLNIQDKT